MLDDMGGRAPRAHVNVGYRQDSGPGRSSHKIWEAPVKVQCTSVGLDVHARSVVACGLDGDTGEVFQRRLSPDHREILEWIHGLPGPVAVTHEAVRRASGWPGSWLRRGWSAGLLRPRRCSVRPGPGEN